MRIKILSAPQGSWYEKQIGSILTPIRRSGDYYVMFELIEFRPEESPRHLLIHGEHCEEIYNEERVALKDTGDIFDPVNRPSHYTDGKIETIDFIEDKKLGFHLGNAVKYISRAGKKDPAKTTEDLQKAIWYINREIDRLKSQQ